MADLAGSHIIQKFSDLLLHEAHLLQGARRQFQGLQAELKVIERRLQDVERQQEDQRVRILLSEIRDVAYDAMNLIDSFILEFKYQQRKGFVKRYASIFKYRSDIYNVGKEIEQFLFRIQDINRSSQIYDIRNIGEGMSSTSSERLRKLRRSSSFVLEKDIVGFEEDTATLVAQLVKKEDRQRSVISIVGMGGLGKTELAKKVYNHGDVRLHFDCLAWVYVSEDFRLRNILEEILKQISNTPTAELQLKQEEELEAMVYDDLEVKRYLVVLDDIWTKEAWDCLARAFPNSSNGSRLLLTTRNRAVALYADPRSIPHQLRFLSEEDSWELFRGKVFFDTHDTSCAPGLEGVGRDIVAKCGGLPLAVVAIGDLLSRKDRLPSVWQSVLDMLRSHFAGHFLLAILHLSYSAMPSYLKQCFAIFSIFPHGYEFNNIQLVQFWMAQGLLQSSTGNQDPEAIGHLYIEQLLFRSFFQEVEEKTPFLTFKLHDLMHDLASLVMTETCKVNSKTSYISERVRHLTFSENNFSNNEFLRLLPTQNQVQTIFFPVEGVGPTSKSFVETCISRYKCLKVMDLSDSCLEMLPSSIGELKHLGYLDLSRSRTLKRLPDSIYELPNLQTLGLLGCVELELFTGKGNFISLRSLSLTTKQMFLPEKKIRHLSSLRFLVIGSCRSLKCLPRAMKCLTALEILHVSHCQKLNLMKWREDISGLKLRLKSVSIGQLQQSMVLPLWLRAASDTLQHIRIEDCPNLIALPEWLPNLTLLEKLEIINCPELVALPIGMQSLAKLRVKVEDCPKLRIESEQETGEQFPKITFLEETSEVVEIIRSRGNHVVSKREIDPTSKSSRSVEGSWWNLELF